MNHSIQIWTNLKNSTLSPTTMGERFKLSITQFFQEAFQPIGYWDSFWRKVKSKLPKHQMGQTTQLPKSRFQKYYH